MNKIRGLHRTNDRRASLQQDLVLLRKRQLPKGIRPVPHTLETFLLDETVTQSGIVQRELDLQLMDLHRAKLTDFV